MKIVQILPGITRFVAKKGDHDIAEEIDVPVVPGIPFEVPDALGQARIHCSPNLYKEATAADEEFAKKFKSQKIEELNNLVQAKTEEKIETKEAADEGKEFDATDYLINQGPHTEKSLEALKGVNLKAIAKVLDIEFPGNVSNKKLIADILVETAKG